MSLTLKQKVERLLEMRREYYIEPWRQEELIKCTKELHLEDVDFLYDTEHTRGELFVCPDTEYEFPVVYEIASEYMPFAIDTIYKAKCDYYNYSDFWEEVAELSCEQIAKIYTAAEKIPIIRYFPVTEVHLLNVRKLNYDTQ